MTDILIEVLKGIVSIFVYAWPIFVVLLFLFAWQNRRKASWIEKSQEVVLEIKIPKTNDKNPTAAEMMFATLHGILRPKRELIRQGSIQEHISFEMVANSTTISFYVWTPKHLKDFVEGQVYAQYPSAEIKEVEDYSRKIDAQKIHVAGSEIVLTKKDFLPIKTFNNFNVDPLAGITGVLSKLDAANEQIWIQILAKPEPDEWKRTGENWVASKKSGQIFINANGLGEWLLKLPLYIIGEIVKAIFSSGATTEAPKLSAETESQIKAVEEKAQKLAFDVKIRVIYLAQDHMLANERLNAIFGAFKQYNTTNLNGFKGRHVMNGQHFLSDYQNRLMLNGGFHLNIEELASIYHLPHTSVETPNINWTTSKTGEPPTVLPTLENTPEDELTLFAETNFRNHKQIFGIKRDDRCRHMYIIGKSGMGKSKLLENLINRDIQSGEGVAVIDPHGDLVAATLAKLPQERLKDVILFDPSDTNFPIGFNPMEVIDESLKIQIASGVLGTFKKIFGTSWGPRLEYVFNYTLLALLDTPGSTLLGVVNMLTDKNYRKNVIANIQDPVVKKFWTTEWASYSEKFATEAVAPILNKVGQFTANSLIRNIIGQPKSTFNIREAMDEGKILLINLSTGKVGETNASLMGAMMITAIQLAAMSRADIAEDDRRDFYLYVDEFQNFATDSFKTILSEARKYHLCLTMANQYVGQMEDTGVKDAIFGNVGTIITFRVGAQDANELSKEFNPPFEPQDLINLARQNIYIRMTIDGQSEQAFSAKTLTVGSDITNIVADVVENSRKLYCRPRPEVEKEIALASGIEIETIQTVTGDTHVQISTPESTITVGNNDTFFEAPIVKKLKKKGGNGSKDDVRKAIAEATSHLSSEPKTQDIKVNTVPTSVATPQLSNEEVQKHVIENLEKTADYIVRHKDGDNKYVFTAAKKPGGVIPDAKGRVKGTPYIKDGKKIYDVTIDMYEPKEYDLFPKNTAPDVWVGDVDEMLSQLEAIGDGLGGGSKFIGIEDHSGNPNNLKKKVESRKASKAAFTIKDKIDKEVLSEILKNAITPTEEKKDTKKEENKINNIENKINPTKQVSEPTKNNNIQTITTPKKPEVKQEGSDIKPAEPIAEKIESKKTVVESKPDFQFPSHSKTEKIVTPDNFKDLKTIHPHEVIKVIKENNDIPQKLDEGETIKFE